MGKDMIAGGAVLGALIIIIMDAILGVGIGIRYWADYERTTLTMAMGIAYYMHFPVNSFISIIICAIAGLCAGVTARGPLYGLIAGIGAYIGSILGILIVAGMASMVFPPMLFIFAFNPSDLAAVVAGSLIWGVWLVLGLAFIGGLLNKEGEWRH